jgi:hypothetical protein
MKVKKTMLSYSVGMFASSKYFLRCSLNIAQPTSLHREKLLFHNLYFPKSFMRMNLGKRQPDKTDKKTTN